MASRRVDRVSRLLKQAISSVLINELSDPRMGFVTVVKVEPSRDLKSAKVYVSVLGEEAVCTRTMRAITHAAGFIRRTVGRQVVLRNVPALKFVRDDSVKRSVHISRLIADVLPDEKPSEESEDR